MKQLTHSLLVSLALGATAFAGENDKKIVTPPTPLDDGWHFSLALPGWAPGIYGEVGINGLLADVSVPADKVVRSADMVGSLRAEVSKGRFGLMGDFLYLTLSDGVGSNTIVKKVDLQIDFTVGELAGRWRLIDHPRGSLDVYAGIRYVNLYQALAIQPDSEKIQESSTALVDTVSDRLRTALSQSGLRDLIEKRLTDGLAGLGDQRPSLPQGPIGGNLPPEIRDQIQQVINERKAELSAALRAGVQKRVDEIKKELSRKIAKTVETKLDTRVSRVDDWWDPFIGLRGRLNLSETWYFTAKGDIGGFGVGSDFAWQAEGALGCQVTRNFFVELGYRALSMDYEDDGLLFDAVAHGAQLTLGVAF